MVTGQTGLVASRQIGIKVNRIIGKEDNRTTGKVNRPLNGCRGWGKGRVAAGRESSQS